MKIVKIEVVKSRECNIEPYIKFTAESGHVFACTVSNTLLHWMGETVKKSRSTGIVLKEGLNAYFEHRDLIPNEETIKAMETCRRGEVEKLESVKELFKCEHKNIRRLDFDGSYCEDCKEPWY